MSAGRERIEQHFPKPEPHWRRYRAPADNPERVQRKATHWARPHLRPARWQSDSYLIRRWPAKRLPSLDRELEEMKRRPIFRSYPLVCELKFSDADNQSDGEMQPSFRNFLLPDPMVIEAEWRQTVVAQKWKYRASSRRAAERQRFLLPGARFALSN